MENLILQLLMDSSSDRTPTSHPSTSPVNGSGADGDEPRMQRHVRSVSSTMELLHSVFLSFWQWRSEMHFEFTVKVSMTGSKQPRSRTRNGSDGSVKGFNG